MPAGKQWNVGPSSRWNIFREADKRCSGIDPGPLCPSKDVLEDTLMHLSQSATLRQFSSAGSGFMFRKVMDSPPKTRSQVLDPYLEKLGKDPSRIERAHRRCAEKEIRRLFPKGWDRNWKAVAADHYVAADKATYTKGLSARDCWAGKHGWWMRHVVDGVEPDWAEQWIPEVRRVSVIDEGGGKRRIVTIASGHQHILAPLNKMIYDKLSRTEWLLRGDATVTSLGKMSYAKGEVFVSGDYEAATDNISSSYPKTYLRLLKASSRFVPEWIWDAAVDSMTGSVELKKRETKVKYSQGNGQMMGNYLSFPLLCLHNYVSFVVGLGSIRAKQIINNGLLKVNGDDILFRASRAEFELWAASVQRSGLVLSRGKTLVHSRFATINSTFFCITKKVRRVPVIKAKTWFYVKDPEKGVVTGDVVVGRLQQVARDCKSKRPVIALFLGVWANEIRRLRMGSVSNGRQLPVPAIVSGLTSARVVYDCMWVDARRATEKTDKSSSLFVPGRAGQYASYFKKLALAHESERVWAEGDLGGKPCESKGERDSMYSKGVSSYQYSMPKVPRYARRLGLTEKNQRNTVKTEWSKGVIRGKEGGFEKSGSLVPKGFRLNEDVKFGGWRPVPGANLVPPENWLSAYQGSNFENPREVPKKDIKPVRKSNKYRAVLRTVKADIGAIHYRRALPGVLSEIRMVGQLGLEAVRGWTRGGLRFLG